MQYLPSNISPDPLLGALYFHWSHHKWTLLGYRANHGFFKSFFSGDASGLLKSFLSFMVEMLVKVQKERGCKMNPVLTDLSWSLVRSIQKSLPWWRDKDDVLVLIVVVYPRHIIIIHIWLVLIRNEFQALRVRLGLRMYNRGKVVGPLLQGKEGNKGSLFPLWFASFPYTRAAF